MHLCASSSKSAHGMIQVTVKCHWQEAPGDMPLKSNFFQSKDISMTVLP